MATTQINMRKREADPGWLFMNELLQKLAGKTSRKVARLFLGERSGNGVKRDARSVRCQTERAIL